MEKLENELSSICRDNNHYRLNQILQFYGETLLKDFLHLTRAVLGRQEKDVNKQLQDTLMNYFLENYVGGILMKAMNVSSKRQVKAELEQEVADLQGPKYMNLLNAFTRRIKELQLSNEYENMLLQVIGDSGASIEIDIDKWKASTRRRMVALLLLVHWTLTNSGWEFQDFFQIWKLSFPQYPLPQRRNKAGKFRDSRPIGKIPSSYNRRQLDDLKNNLANRQNFPQEDHQRVSKGSNLSEQHRFSKAKWMQHQKYSQSSLQNLQLTPTASQGSVMPVNYNRSMKQMQPTRFQTFLSQREENDHWNLQKQPQPSYQEFNRQSDDISRLLPDRTYSTKADLHQHISSNESQVSFNSWFDDRYLADNDQEKIKQSGSVGHTGHNLDQLDNHPTHNEGLYHCEVNNQNHEAHHYLQQENVMRQSEPSLSNRLSNEKNTLRCYQKPQGAVQCTCECGQMKQRQMMDSWCLPADLVNDVSLTSFPPESSTEAFWYKKPQSLQNHCRIQPNMSSPIIVYNESRPVNDPLMAFENEIMQESAQIEDAIFPFSDHNDQDPGIDDFDSKPFDAFELSGFSSMERIGSFPKENIKRHLI